MIAYAMRSEFWLVIGLITAAAGAVVFVLEIVLARRDAAREAREMAERLARRELTRDRQQQT